MRCSGTLPARGGGAGGRRPGTGRRWGGDPARVPGHTRRDRGQDRGGGGGNGSGRRVSWATHRALSQGTQQPGGRARRPGSDGEAAARRRDRAHRDPGRAGSAGPVRDPASRGEPRRDPGHAAPRSRTSLAEGAGGPGRRECSPRRFRGPARPVGRSAGGDQSASQRGEPAAREGRGGASDAGQGRREPRPHRGPAVGDRDPLPSLEHRDQAARSGAPKPLLADRSAEGQT